MKKKLFFYRCFWVLKIIISLIFFLLSIAYGSDTLNITKSWIGPFFQNGPKYLRKLVCNVGNLKKIVFRFLHSAHLTKMVMQRSRIQKFFHRKLVLCLINERLQNCTYLGSFYILFFHLLGVMVIKINSIQNWQDLKYDVSLFKYYNFFSMQIKMTY